MYCELGVLLVLVIGVHTTCVPHASSTYVSDTCSLASLDNVTAALSVTDSDGSGGFVTRTIGQLLDVAKVLAPAVLYDPTAPITYQQVTGVDALTVDVKLTSSASNHYTADVSQILAAGLFARAADGIYPNIQDPFLGRNIELDQVVALLTELTYTTALIADRLIAHVPLTVQQNAGVLTTQAVSVADLLAEGLFVLDTKSMAGGPTDSVYNVQVIPIARGLLTPYLDPLVAASSPAAGQNCDVGSQVSGTMPDSAYGPYVHARNLNSNVGSERTLAGLSGMPLLRTQTCSSSHAITSPLPQTNVLVQPSGAYSAQVTTPYCTSSGSCGSYTPPT